MVRLTAKNDWQRNKWYFYNKKDAKKFMGVFEDHGCNIKWEITEKDKFPEMDSEDMRYMDEKPKKRANDDLCWAFNSYMHQNREADVSIEIAGGIINHLGL